MPRVSVVMPAYNAEPYIAEAIESILNQTFADFECIIIDDGSADRTADVIRGFSDPRIRFVQNERNEGVAAALNRGLALASGEYIARMDADDICFPDRFEKQVAYMDTHPEVAVLATGTEKFGRDRGVMLFSERWETLKIDLLFACCFAHPSVMIRAAVLKRTGLCYDPSFSRMEDYDLWDRLSVENRLAALPDVLLRYRIHASQVTCQKTEADLLQLRALKERQVERLGMAAGGDGFESFLSFCAGSFVPARESLLSLSRFFHTLRQRNGVTWVYDGVLLDRYLKDVLTSLLYRMPLRESLFLANECGVSAVPYAVKRVARGVLSRMKESIQTKKR